MSLCFVSDERFVRPAPGENREEAFFRVVEEAVQGGVSLVQLREKSLSSRAFYRRALRLKEILRPYQTPLVINDRADIALAVEAEGLHIGRSDLPYPPVRRLLGKESIIGLSVESLDELAAIQEDADFADLDYVSLSPLFATGTKTDTAPPFGLEKLREAVSFSKYPVMVIGGIHAGNTATVTQAGAEGIALVSAIMGAADPREAAASLWREIQAGKQARSK